MSPLKIVCNYPEWSPALNRIVDITLEQHAKELDLSNLKTIELIDSNKFSYDTDGKAVDDGTRIILTSRCFKMLDSENADNDTICLQIISTLYHELCHVSDFKKMPLIHQAAEQLSNDASKGLPSLFFLEYLAEKRSSSINPEIHRPFCDDFASRKWKATKYNYYDSSESNYFYLLKACPYYIARVENLSGTDSHIKSVRNTLLKKMILEQRPLIHNYENIPVEKPEELSQLYMIMDKYYRLFKKAF